MGKYRVLTSAEMGSCDSDCDMDEQDRCDCTDRREESVRQLLASKQKYVKGAVVGFVVEKETGKILTLKGYSNLSEILRDENIVPCIEQTTYYIEGVDLKLDIVYSKGQKYEKVLVVFREMREGKDPVRMARKIKEQGGLTANQVNYYTKGIGRYLEDYKTDKNKVRKSNLKKVLKDLYGM